MKNQIDDTVSLAKWIDSITASPHKSLLQCLSFVANWQIGTFSTPRSNPFLLTFCGIWITFWIKEIYHSLYQLNVLLYQIPKSYRLVVAAFPSHLPRSRSSPWVLQGKAHLNPPSSQSHPEMFWLETRTTQQVDKSGGSSVCLNQVLQKYLASKYQFVLWPFTISLRPPSRNLSNSDFFSKVKDQEDHIFESRGAHKVRD